MCARSNVNLLKDIVYATPFLYIRVAKGSSHGARGLLNGQRTRVSGSHVERIRKLCGGRSHVGHHSRAIQSLGTLSRLKILPNPVDAVNRRMVEEEEGVAGRGCEVATWITTNDEVTTRVHTHEVVLKVVGGRSALESLPERLVVLTLEQRDNVVILEPSFAGEARDVASQTARVVSQTISRLCEVGVGVWRRAFGSREERTDIDLPVLEWTRLDTATSLTVRNLDLGVGVEGNSSESLVAAALDTLSGNRCVRAVK